MVARMQLLFASLICGAAPAASKAQLPTMPRSHRDSQDYLATLDDKVLLAPPPGSGLSANVDDYYYAYGSPEAVDNSALSEHRVAGTGRLHVFHLPPGAAALLQVQSSTARSGRRSSISDLKKLEQGASLEAKFPAYEPSEDYSNPLDEAGQALEKQAVAEVTSELFLENLKALTTLPAGTRSWSNEEAGSDAIDFLQGRFEHMGLTTCVQRFTYSGNKLANVVAFLPGDPNLDATAGSVTIGAHYDSRPFTGSAPGAEDNGSGVAALLSIAKAATDLAVRPTKPIYFVAFAGEEAGMLGSKRFAQALVDLGDASLPHECRPEQVQKMSFLQKKQLSKADLERNLGLIMDEIGWRSPNIEGDTVNLETYDLPGDLSFIDTLAHSSRTHNGDSLRIVHNSNPFGSDHMSFLDNNMVGALTINADDDGYPNYHQSSDTIDNVSPEYAAKIAKMNMGALLRVSGITGKK